MSYPNAPTEEDVLRETLANMQRSYHDAAKPLVDRLVEIEALKPSRPLIVTMTPGEIPSRIYEIMREADEEIAKMGHKLSG